MKKYLVILASAVLALSMASCSKEEAVKDNAKASTTVYLKALLNNTKTVANADDPTKTEWESSDAISVFVSTEGSTDYSDNTKFTVANAAEGIFTGEVEKTFDEEEIYSWSMLYPYTSAIDSPASTTKYLTLGSATQTQKKADDYSHALAGKYVPLVGTALSIGDKFDEGEPATMHHLTSVVKYNITNTESEPIVITSIRFDAAAEISGTYYVDFSDVENIKYTAKGANKNVTLILTDGTIAAGETASFYVVTRPFEVAASSSNSITITADKGQIKKTWTPSAKVSVAAGAIQTFNISYVAPVATSFAEINAGRTASSYMTPSATIVAAVPNGNGNYAVAYDGTDYMLLFNTKIDSKQTVATKGNVYAVSGDVVNYYGIMEWSYPALVDLEETATVTHPTLEEYGATELAAYKTAASVETPELVLHYVTLEGTVASSMLTVGDYDVKLLSSESIPNGSGSVTGYLYGYNSKYSYFSLIVTESDVEAEVSAADYSLTFPTYNDKGVTTYTDTWTATKDSHKWTIANFNNNGNSASWTYIKCGRKSNDSVATITSDVLPEAIKTVAVTYDKVSNVNTTYLEVSDDAFNTVKEKITIAAPVAGVNTYTVSSPTANCQYRITIDNKSASGNGSVQISKLEYSK